MSGKSTPPKVAVRYPPERGAVRVGAYEPGKVYEVEPAEAQRLVEMKGFEYADGDAGESEE